MKKHHRPDGGWIELTQEEWIEQYHPLLLNHFTPNEGNRFEILGEQSEFVKQQDPATVWTLMDDCDGGVSYHWVNRLGYYISTRPRPDDITIVVSLKSHGDFYALDAD